MATATEDMKAVAPFPDDAPFIEELTEEEALAEEEVSLVWCTCCASKKYLLQQIDIFMHIVSYNFYIIVLLLQMNVAQGEEAKQNPAEEDEEEEKIEDADPEERARSKIWQELDCIDSAAKEGYVNERYNYAYSEYKRGLKSLSDLVIGREAREDPELKAKYMERRRKVREEKMY